MRALAAAYGEPIHLRLSAKYGSSGFVELLRAQPYLGSVHALEHWQVEESAPITPRAPEMLWGVQARAVYHLGYEGWPTPHLPGDVYRRVAYQIGQSQAPVVLPELELATPWITARLWPQVPHRIAIGFTDEHFELKYGICRLLEKVDLQSTAFLLTAPGSRWEREADTEAVGWVEAARRIVAAELFLGCCSALHVLAIGLGVPAVIVEPNPNRLGEVFWPLGQDSRQVRLVRGNDGNATVDARHCADALTEALDASR